MSSDADDEWPDDHADRLDAMADELAALDPDDVEAAVLVVVGEEATDLLPAVREDVHANRSWVALATHLNYLAETYPVAPDTAAQFATDMAATQAATGPPGDYDTNSGEGGWR